LSRTWAAPRSLPALAQWFAAQSLLLGETDVEDLLGAPEDLELWRYPVGLVVALGSWEQSKACLLPLLDRAPGFAFRVLAVAFSQALVSGNPAPPWREAGKQAREALQAMLDAAGDVRALTSVTDPSGRVRPMAVSTTDDGVTVAFWQGASERPDVFAMPSDVGFFSHDWDWGPIRMARVGSGATWAWQWARDTFKGELVRRIKSRSLPIPAEGPLADEVVWSFGCARLRQSVLITEKLPIEPLLTSITDSIASVGDVDGLTISIPGEGDYDAFAIRRYLERRLEVGDEELWAPLPPADRDRGGGLIGEFYTDDRLTEIATALYYQAIAAYRQLAERWFSPLIDQMEHHFLMPLRVVGQVYPGDPERYGRIPTLAGWIEALPEGSEDEVVISIAEQYYDFSDGAHSYAQQQRARPAAARWLRRTHGGLSFEIGRRSPVADAAYAWLVGDLERLGLAGPLDKSPSDVRTHWDQ
jgi:hypothetical protein